MEHRREELLDFVSWEDFWSSENKESRLYEAVLENFEADDKWDRAAYEVEIKQPFNRKLPWYNQVMENLFDKKYDKRSTVNEIDTLLLDEEQNEIHYIELKKKKENHRYEAIRQVDRASHLFQNIGYKFSASLVFFENNHYECYPVLCFNRTNPPKVPVELEKIISNDIRREASNTNIEQDRYEELLPIDPDRHREHLRQNRDYLNQKPFWQQEPWKPSALGQLHRWVRIKEPEIRLKDGNRDFFEWFFPLEPHRDFDEESLLEWSENCSMTGAELVENSEEYKFRIEKEVENSEAEIIKESISEASEGTWYPASSLQELL